MGGPGSGPRKGSGGKSSAMKGAISARNHAKGGGMTISGTSPKVRYAKANKKIKYLKRTGQ